MTRTVQEEKKSDSVIREEEELMAKWGLVVEERQEQGMEFWDVYGYPEGLNTWAGLVHNVLAMRGLRWTATPLRKAPSLPERTSWISAMKRAKTVREAVKK